MDYKIETVIKQAASVGEGPHWDDVTQTLLYIDITSGDVHRWDPATGKDDKIHLDGKVGFVIPRSKGGLVVGLNRTVASVDWDSKTVTTLATVDEPSDNRLNDGKCDAYGRLWAGTMDVAWSPKADPVHNLYCLSTDGTLKKQQGGIAVSNGMAWTEDNKIMFYIDSQTQQVHAYDFDLEQGTVSNRRVAVDFTKIPDFADKIPYPDGMTIDIDDNLWVACIGRGLIGKFDPQTGKLLQKVAIPNASLVSSVCWGGPDFDELYVTSVNGGFSEEQLKTTESLAGSVFKVTGLGTRGKPANLFRG